MEVPPSEIRHRRVETAVWLTVVALSCFRLAHRDLLWADEDYHLAAAIDILHGKVLYRDFWYDKPPLNALFYLLIGGHAGWLLRLLDAAYVSASCYVIFKLASAIWSRVEGYGAALLLAFYTTFYLPSAVIPFAADGVMLLPHVLAIYFAQRGKAMAAGCTASLAFLANPKALFVLASCGLFLSPQLGWLVASFAGACLLAAGGLAVVGAWPGYVEQVWRWGLIYARQPPLAHPIQNGLTRSMNWMGFHAAAVVGAGAFLLQSRGRNRWQIAGWLLLSFLAVGLGGRFAPHYFLQLLPAVVIAAARGLVICYRWQRRTTVAVAVLLLAVPAARFGPRYGELTFDGEPARWADVALDLDSREVAQKIRSQGRADDSLFVWGYRPDIYVYSRLVSDSLFWDSQPLTGVPADRHLSVSTPIFGEAAAINRRELMRSRPTWIVDGLGLLNPKLRLDSYADLHAWFSQYVPAGRTKLSLIYRLKK